MKRYDKDKALFWFLFLLIIAVLIVGIIGTPKQKKAAKDVEKEIIVDEVEEVIEEAVEDVNIPARNDFYIAECKLSKEMQNAVYDACNDTGIPFNIALGLIEVESNFNAEAVNTKTGCYGYCQLHPTYFPNDLSPEENIATGIKWLARLYGNNGGDIAKALTIYNAGHDTGSRTYASMVLKAADKWG